LAVKQKAAVWLEKQNLSTCLAFQTAAGIRLLGLFTISPRQPALTGPMGISGSIALPALANIQLLNFGIIP